MQWQRIMYLLLACGVLVSGWWMFFKKPERWAVYYAKELPAEAFLPYDVLVFDRDGHPQLPLLQNGKRILLGYMSFGEAEIHRKDYPQVQALDVLISDVPDWEGNPFLDVRKPQWRRYVLETIMPAILNEGFNGVMIDTVDNLTWLEHNHPADYAGITQATIDLIKDIHHRFPTAYIMMNRGLDILPNVACDIQMLLAESVYTSWDVANGKPAMAPDNVQQDYLNKIQPIQKQCRKLKVYSLDYWPPEDAEAVKTIYKRQRAKGFVPYVSTMDLQKLYSE